MEAGGVEASCGAESVDHVCLLGGKSNAVVLEKCRRGCSVKCRAKKPKTSCIDRVRQSNGNEKKLNPSCQEGKPHNSAFFYFSSKNDNRHRQQNILDDLPLPETAPDKGPPDQRKPAKQIRVGEAYPCPRQSPPCRAISNIACSPRRDIGSRSATKNY